MNRKKGIEAKKKGKDINKTGQTDKMKEEISTMEAAEDVTKYGEFVSSYFAWLTLDKQKNQAKKMEKMTNNNEKTF